jgi:hypothetical protein
MKAMACADDNTARAAEAEALAARCVSGSAEQRQFLDIAEQWRARERRIPAPPPQPRSPA